MFIIDPNAYWAIAIAGLVWDIILQIATAKGFPSHLDTYYCELGSGLGIFFSVLAVVVGLLTAEAILQIKQVIEDRSKQ